MDKTRFSERNFSKSKQTGEITALPGPFNYEDSRSMAMLNIQYNENGYHSHTYLPKRNTLLLGAFTLQISTVFHCAVLSKHDQLQDVE